MCFASNSARKLWTDGSVFTTPTTACGPTDRRWPLIPILLIQNSAEPQTRSAHTHRHSLRQTPPSLIQFFLLVDRLRVAAARLSRCYIAGSVVAARSWPFALGSGASPMWQNPEIDCFNFRASSAAGLRYDALSDAAERTRLTESYGLRCQIIRLSARTAVSASLSRGTCRSRLTPVSW